MTAGRLVTVDQSAKHCEQSFLQNKSVNFLCFTLIPLTPVRGTEFMVDSNLYAFNLSDWERTQSFVSTELAAICGAGGLDTIHMPDTATPLSHRDYTHTHTTTPA